MATNEFKTISTQPNTYLGSSNQVVNGYRIYFQIVGYESESHYVDVPNLDEITWRPAIQKVVSQRKALP